MRAKTFLTASMILYSLFAFGQFTPHDRPAQATFTPLTPDQIMAPAMQQRQRADRNADMLNDVIRQVVDLRRQTTDRQLLEFLDAELQALRALRNTDLARAENVIRQRVDRLVDGVDRHERRIAEERRINEIRIAEERRINEMRVAEERYINAGRNELNNGFYQLAITHLQRALEINSNNATTHHLLGIAHSRSGNHTQAIRFYHRAIALNQNWCAPVFNLALIHDRLGNDRERNQYLQRSARLGNTTAQNFLRDNGYTW